MNVNVSAITGSSVRGMVRSQSDDSFRQDIAADEAVNEIYTGEGQPMSTKELVSRLAELDEENGELRFALGRTRNELERIKSERDRCLTVIKEVKSILNRRQVI